MSLDLSVSGCNTGGTSSTAITVQQNVLKFPQLVKSTPNNNNKNGNNNSSVLVRKSIDPDIMKSISDMKEMTISSSRENPINMIEPTQTFVLDRQGSGPESIDYNNNNNNSNSQIKKTTTITRIGNKGSTKPKGMKRAKIWTPEVENFYRYQLAGFTDENEYLSSYEQPGYWEGVGLVRCLRNKKSGYFMYFRQTRECEDKHLNKIKIYEY
jgi:hypothetical protein